jgi:hypothetical protein
METREALAVLVRDFWHHFHGCGPDYPVRVLISSSRITLRSDSKLPASFLAIIPAIMQRIVDTTDLPVHAATIMRPTAGGVQFSLDASFKVPPGITVGLKPFTIGLFNEGGNSSNPYLKLSLPEIKLKGNTTISVANQETQILDLAQFTDFIGTYVKSEEFTISESASTNAFLGALNVPIKLNKNIKMKG